MLTTFFKLGAAAISTAIATTMIRVGAIDFSEQPGIAAVGVALTITAVVLWINLGIAFFKLCRRRPVVAFLSGIAAIGIAAYGFGEHIDAAFRALADSPSAAQIATVVVSVLAVIAAVAWLLGVLQAATGKREKADDRPDSEPLDDDRVVEFPNGNGAEVSDKVAQSG